MPPECGLKSRPNTAVTRARHGTFRRHFNEDWGREPPRDPKKRVFENPQDLHTHIKTLHPLHLPPPLYTISYSREHIDHSRDLLAVWCRKVRDPKCDLKRKSSGHGHLQATGSAPSPRRAAVVPSLRVVLRFRHVGAASAPPLLPLDVIGRCGGAACGCPR